MASQQNRWRMLFLSGLGGLLEFYDFIIFALFAAYIADHFFPSDSDVISLLNTFVTFSTGYLIRPIGGIVFGHLGDRYGRKSTFIASIFIMALATLGIGVLPTYEQIGWYAPVLLLLCRLLQGFSVGGEIPGAITYVSELMAEEKAKACSVIFFFLIMGIVTGQLISSLLNSALSPESMESWGWRIPFILGGILGIASYYLRKQFQESPFFKQMEAAKHKVPVMVLLKEHKLMLCYGSLQVALGALLITLLFLFTPAYLTKLLNYDARSFDWIFTAGMALTATITLIYGLFVDKTNKNKLLFLIAVLSFICAYPIFYLYIHHEAIIQAVLLSALSLGLIWSVIPAQLTELFPTAYRYSGVGLCYNIGFALFGGLTPVIAMLLIQTTGRLDSPSYYLMLVAFLAMISSYLFSKKPVDVFS